MVNIKRQNRNKNMQNIFQVITSRLFGVAVIAILVLNSCKSTAQISTRVEEVGGVSYYIHDVKKGETLYSLSKLYGCDLNDLSAANVGVDQGLKEGQVIRIPVAKSKTKSGNNQSAIASNGRKHTVQKKETLFSIAQLYNVDINKLIAANPGSDKGIKKGQELIIPDNKTQKEVTKPAEPEITITKHTVAAGETLYGLARKYGVTIAALQGMNGGLPDGLKIGQEINVPGTNAAAVNTGGNSIPEGPILPIEIMAPVYQDKYKMALMLPFYINYNDTMESRDRKFRDVALQMYRGALMAADTLEQNGLKADLYMYDVLDDKKMVSKVLEKPEMKEMDLIIGPIFRDPLIEASLWGANHGVHIACPVQQPNKVLLNSPNMTKAVPSSATQWLTLTKHIYKKHKNDNIILINSKNIDDLKQISVIKEEWKKNAGDSIRHEIIVADASSFSVKDRYVSGKKNVILVPTNDKKVIATLFRVLGDGDIIVYGTEYWDDLETINVANRNKYELHFPQTTFIDYNDVRTQKWIEAYRKKYKSEPGKFAFAGYDMTLYYGMGLKQFGRAFPNHLNEIKCSTYSMDFDFFRTGNEAGFENQAISVIGTSNYELIQENID